jgi:hypothetical protein
MDIAGPTRLVSLRLASTSALLTITVLRMKPPEKFVQRYWAASEDL